MTNWPFYSNFVMPQDRIFDWEHNSPAYLLWPESWRKIDTAYLQTITRFTSCKAVTSLLVTIQDSNAKTDTANVVLATRTPKKTMIGIAFSHQLHPQEVIDPHRSPLYLGACRPDKWRKEAGWPDFGPLVHRPEPSMRRNSCGLFCSGPLQRLCQTG